MENKNDTRATITEAILTAMESGQLDWTRPWNCPGMPHNFISKKNYRGMNVPNLWAAAARMGTDDPRWMTFNQARTAGLKVKKGAKGTKVLFWGSVSKETDVTDSDGNAVVEHHPVFKVFTVFNGSQIEGMEEYVEAPSREIEVDEKCEAILTGCPVEISYDGGAEAYYAPGSDTIHLPERKNFKSDAHFYATALHEIAHSTGHKSRLDRDMKGSRFSASYAYEELVAEMTSAFVIADIGLIVDDAEMEEHIQQHASYIQSWLSGCRKDKKILENAIADATKAANLILNYGAEDKESGDGSEPLDIAA